MTSTNYNNVRLYQLDDTVTPMVPLSPSPAFTFSICKVDLEFSRQVDDVDIPGQLLQAIKWDSKTQRRPITIDFDLVSGGTYSAGNGQGNLAQQVADLVGIAGSGAVDTTRLYTVSETNPDGDTTLASIKYNTDTTSDASRGVNRSGIYCLQIPFPDGTQYYAIGSVKLLRFNFFPGSVGNLSGTLQFEEAESVLGLG